MVLIRALIAALILSIPWVKWEISPRVTITEAIFASSLLVLLIETLRGRTKVLSHMVRNPFMPIIAFVVLASFLSGIHAPHVTNYLFESAGMAYLGLLALTISVLLVQDEEWFDSAGRWLMYSTAIVGTVCLIGIIKRFVFGFGDLFLFSNTAKLIATFKYPNQLAGFLVLLIPVAWEFLWKAYGKRRLFYSMLCLVMLAAVAATCSRTGLAVVFALAVGYGIWGLVRKRYKLVITVVLAGIIVLGTVLLVVTIAGDENGASPLPGSKAIFSLVSEVFSRGQVTDTFRLENWANGVRLFLVHPLTGYGLGNIWLDYGHEVHNTYLSILAETGALGALAFLILLTYITLLGYQNLRLASILRPRWTPYARGMFAGLLAEYLFATQHVVIRSRHLWLIFGVIVAMNTLLRKAETKEGKEDVRNLRHTVT